MLLNDFNHIWIFSTDFRKGPHIKFHENLCSGNHAENQCQQEWVCGKLIQITRVQWNGRGHGVQLCCICFCLSQSYHNLSIVQINPFIPSPNHSATESCSLQISIKIFNQSTRIGRPKPTLSSPAGTCRQMDGQTG
jgi:hypothetical protein